MNPYGRLLAVDAMHDRVRRGRVDLKESPRLHVNSFLPPPRPIYSVLGQIMNNDQYMFSKLLVKNY